MALLLLMVFNLVACSPIKLPSVSYYTLGSASGLADASTRGASTKKTLLLNDIVASSGYTTNKMLYANIPYKLKAFADNAWVAPPATMLLPMLANRIRQTHYFSAVVTSPYVGAADYVLSARLLVLQQEFLRPVSRVRMVLSVTVLNSRTHRVVGNRIFQSVAMAPRNNPYSGVLAANKDAQQIAFQVARYVKRKCA